MKLFLFAIALFSISISFAQTELTNPKTGCKFVMPWTCTTCTFQWTGDCENNLPNGVGVMSVFNEGNEIMRYEGEMRNGVFNGPGSYRDGMNEFSGNFVNGNLAINSNQYNTQIDTTTFNKTPNWETKTEVTKQIGNLYFIFPGEGYAFEHRDEYVQQCIDAFAKNCKIINDPEFVEFTKIRFVTSKKEMLLHANLYVTGQADNVTRTVDMVVSNEDEDEDKKITKPPLTHEIMHMVSKTAWGNPPGHLSWLNEGLATYAENNCSGYTVAEIYRYFLENDMLIPIETLNYNFYQTEEMIGYHQSAAIVEYLITNYGIAKLEALWKSGFENFEKIYGFPYATMEAALNKSILVKFPQSPEIDWQTLKKGCK